MFQCGSLRIKSARLCISAMYLSFKTVCIWYNSRPLRLFLSDCLTLSCMRTIPLLHGCVCVCVMYVTVFECQRIRLYRCICCALCECCFISRWIEVIGSVTCAARITRTFSRLDSGGIPSPPEHSMSVERHPF